MSECKTVTLRTRPLKKGMLSFYLDYYPGYRDQETMKTIRHEGLNIYIYANPKNQRERDFNAAMSEKAEAIRCRRFEAIVNERYDFFDKHKYKLSGVLPQAAPQARPEMGIRLPAFLQLRPRQMHFRGNRR